MRHQKCSLGTRASDGTLINPAGLSLTQQACPCCQTPTGLTAALGQRLHLHPNTTSFDSSFRTLHSSVCHQKTPRGGRATDTALALQNRHQSQYKKFGNFQAHSPHCSLKSSPAPLSRSAWRTAAAPRSQRPWRG